MSYRIPSMFVSCSCMLLLLSSCISVNSQTITQGPHILNMSVFQDSSCTQPFTGFQSVTGLPTSGDSDCISPPSQWMAHGVASFTAVCANWTHNDDWSMMLIVRQYSAPNCPSITNPRSNFTTVSYSGQSDHNAASGTCVPFLQPWTKVYVLSFLCFFLSGDPVTIDCSLAGLIHCEVRWSH